MSYGNLRCKVLIESHQQSTEAPLNGRTVVIALVIGLVAGAGATYLLWGGQDLGARTTTVTSTSTTTSTVTLDLTKQVSDAFMVHLQAIHSQNMTTLVGEYTDNATLGMFTNSPIGGMGASTNNGQVEKFYAEAIFLGHSHPTVDFANESYTTTISSNESTATIQANLTYYGESLYGPCGSNPCTVYVDNARLTVNFVRAGGDWLISNEYWYNVNGIDGCQSFGTPPCSTLLSSPNWSEYVLAQQ